MDDGATSNNVEEERRVGGPLVVEGEDGEEGEGEEEGEDHSDEDDGGDGSERKKKKKKKNDPPPKSPEVLAREQKHARVINCLEQLQSLNLERPEGMVVSRSPDDIIRKLPKISHSPNDPAAREKADQYQFEIDEMIELHREFSRNNQRLWRKVSRAVQMISRMTVTAARNKEKVGAHDPSIHTTISQAMSDRQEHEKQQLLQVKSAFQELKAQGEKNGRIKKSKMNKILSSLGVKTILEVAKKKTNTYTMSIMDRVNLCADYWLGQIEKEHPQQATMIHLDDLPHRQLSERY